MAVALASISRERGATKWSMIADTRAPASPRLDHRSFRYWCLFGIQVRERVTLETMAWTGAPTRPPLRGWGRNGFEWSALSSGRRARADRRIPARLDRAPGRPALRGGAAAAAWRLR